MKNSQIINAIIFFVFSFLAKSQVIFNQTFEQYNLTSGGGVAYLTYNHTWYRSDVNKTTGLFKIKGPSMNPLFHSNYMAIFSESPSSVSCVDFSLQIGSIYQLQYDYSWELHTSNFTVKWNGLIIFNIITGNSTSGTYVHQTHLLPAVVNSNNTLCFLGYHVDSSLRIGPTVDNVIITFVSGPQAGNPTNSSGNTTNSTNFSSSSTNSTNFSSSSTNSVTIQTNTSLNCTNQEQNLIQNIKVEWVKQFAVYFNQFLRVTSFFGFSYLISNLLNFWNIVVIYYFLSIDNFFDIYKVELQKLCNMSLQEGNIFSLISKTKINFNIQIPQLTSQSIPATSTKWPSFLQMGITSQILRNNIQEYFSIFLCGIKLLCLKFFIYLIKRYKCCLSKIVIGVNIRNIQIFFYEVVSSSPSMILALAVMLSNYSSLGNINYYQKINNLFQILTMIFLFSCSLIPILIQYKPQNLKKPVKMVVKSTVLVQSHHQVDSNRRKKTVAFQQSEETVKKATTKIKQQQKYNKKVENYNKQQTYQKYLYWCYVIEIFNKALFFTVPFLIGLKIIQLFFIVNFFVIVITIQIELKSGSIIRQFNPKEFWFNIVIKLVFLITHILFAVLFIQDKNIINLPLDQIGIINVLCLFIIILGALIQTFHSILNLIRWIYEIVKKLRVQKDSKVTTSNEGTMEPNKKNLQLIHARKDTQAQLNPLPQQNQQEEAIQNKDQGSKMKRSVIIIKNIGRKTQRISTKMFNS